MIHHGLDFTDTPSRDEPGDYLLVVGRVSPEKGIAEAIQLARRTGHQLVIAAKVREQDEQDLFDAVVKPAIESGTVDWRGEVDGPERDRLMAGALATLMLGGWPEPFGLVAVESMATGTPVIARRAGGYTETVEHGVNGFLVDDVEEARLAVERIRDLSRARRPDDRARALLGRPDDARVRGGVQAGARGEWIFGERYESRSDRSRAGGTGTAATEAAAPPMTVAGTFLDDGSERLSWSATFPAPQPTTGRRTVRFDRDGVSASEVDGVAFDERQRPESVPSGSYVRSPDGSSRVRRSKHRFDRGADSKGHGGTTARECSFTRRPGTFGCMPGRLIRRQALNAAIRCEVAGRCPGRARRRADTCRRR